MKGRFLIASTILAVISLIAVNILLPDIVETYTIAYATRYNDMIALIIGTIDALSNLPVAYTGNTFYTMFALWFIAGLITGAIIRKPESSLVGGMFTGVVFGLILIFVLASEQGIDIRIVFKDLFCQEPR
jgi:ABC-type thiamin/hydroxymethylpyrimidine transport system permease subunit